MAEHNYLLIFRNQLHVFGFLLTLMRAVELLTLKINGPFLKVMTFCDKA